MAKKNKVKDIAAVLKKAGLKSAEDIAGTTVADLVKLGINTLDAETVISHAKQIVALKTQHPPKSSLSRKKTKRKKAKKSLAMKEPKKEEKEPKKDEIVKPRKAKDDITTRKLQPKQKREKPIKENKTASKKVERVASKNGEKKEVDRKVKEFRKRLKKSPDLKKKVIKVLMSKKQYRQQVLEKIADAFKSKG